jgi:hypothetical protein
VNRTERSVLTPVIKRLRKQNPHVWWELKRQIWDGGFQPYYPMQGEFEFPATRALERLDIERLGILRNEWERRHPGKAPDTAAVICHYVAVIQEELVKRATLAAYRTTHW